MKNLILTVTMFSVLTLSACANHEPQENNLAQNAYLGQTPPGLTPQPFAPGLVTTPGYEYGGVFTPDLEAFYFLRWNEEIEQQEMVVVRRVENQWKKSVVSKRVGQPVFSPDGNTMHLGNRAKVRIANGQWSEPESLGAPFDDFPIMRMSSSAAGTRYFDEFKQDLTGDIRFSRKVNGAYETPRLVGDSINTGRSFHPFIAPDESYLIFDGKRDGGYGDSDLYISYRTKDGAWGEPINLGDQINTPAWEAAGNVTSDGKYLFFNRMIGPRADQNVDILWVGAAFLEALRPN